MSTNDYTFSFSNPAKPTFVVAANTKDSTHTSLTLTGRGSPNWGRDLQENLLWLLENFAGPTPPANMVEGQLWYDSVNKTLKVLSLGAGGAPEWNQASGGVASSNTQPVNPQIGAQWYNPSTGILSIWDGTAWKQVYPGSGDATKVAYVTEYNSMADSVNQILGTPTGTTLATAFGYGQTAVPHESVGTLTNAKWLSLLQVITRLANFLGLSTSGISQYGFIYESGNTTPVGVVTLLSTYQTTLSTIAGFLAGNTRFTPSAGSLESNVPVSGTKTRSTVWSGTVTHEVVAGFATPDAMNAYFNAGGKIQFQASLTGALTGRDFAVASLLSALATISWGATGATGGVGSNATGFYNLNNTYQTIYQSVSGTNSYVLQAKLDDNKTIHFQVQFTSTGSLYGGVGGTLQSKALLVRASALYMNSPSISYPAVSQAGTM